VFPGVPAKSVSELFEESDLVVRGVVDYIDLVDGNIEKDKANRIAVLTVQDSLKSRTELADKITIYYVFLGGTLDNYCSPQYGTHFVSGEEYTVFLQSENDRFHVTHTSGEYGLTYFYDHDQIYDFLRDGKDSPLRSNFCFYSVSIEQIYKSEFLEDGIFDHANMSPNGEYAECVYQPMKKPKMPKLWTR